MAKHQLRTSTIYCGDNLKMLPEIPDENVDLIYIDPPFNSNRNYETFWGDTQEKRALAVPKRISSTQDCIKRNDESSTNSSQFQEIILWKIIKWKKDVIFDSGLINVDVSGKYMATIWTSTN